MRDRSVKTVLSLDIPRNSLFNQLFRKFTRLCRAIWRRWARQRTICPRRCNIWRGQSRAKEDTHRWGPWGWWKICPRRVSDGGMTDISCFSVFFLCVCVCVSDGCFFWKRVLRYGKAQCLLITVQLRITMGKAIGKYWTELYIHGVELTSKE
jgi:hypothetical protein